MTYYFTGMFAISADNEAEARDGLLELLAYRVGRDDSEAFILEEVEGEENAQ